MGSLSACFQEHDVDAENIFQSSGLVGLHLALRFIEEWLVHPAFTGKGPNPLAYFIYCYPPYHVLSPILQWYGLLHLTRQLHNGFNPSLSHKQTPFSLKMLPHILALRSFTQFVAIGDLTIYVVSHPDRAFLFAP